MRSDWQEIPLSEALMINPSVKMERGKIYPYVDMQSIEAGRKYVEPQQEREFKGSGSRFLNGDTLMARITPCLENGKISRYKSSDNIPAHGSTEFIVLRNKPKLTDSEFVYYLTVSDSVRLYAISQMTGSSGRQRVPVDALKHLVIHLPSLSEQKAIADVLRKIDTKIELNRQMCQTLEAMAATLFKSWFVDFDPVTAKAEGREPEGLSADIAALFPDEVEDSEIGPIPRGWNIDVIGNLTETVGGATPSTKSREYWDGEHYWATPKDLSALNHNILLQTERKITDAGLGKISSGLLPSGTVLLSSRAPIGYVAIAEVPVAINQGFIAMKCTKKIGPQFALQWVLANMEMIKSRANGSTFQEVSKKAFRPIRVCYPPDRLLREFESIAEDLHAKCINIIMQNNSLIAMRDTLLPQLISGALRVDDVEEV